MGGCIAKPNSSVSKVGVPLTLDALSGDSELVRYASSRISNSTELFINDASISIKEKETYLRSCHQLFLKRHSDAVASIAITSDSVNVVSGSKDKTIKIWNLTEMKQIGEINQNLEINQIVISKDNKYIYSLAGSQKVTQWNFKTLANEREYEIIDYNVASIAVSPCGNYLYIGGGFLPGQNACPIRVFDSFTGRANNSYFGHGAASTCMIFSSDEKYMVSCSGGQYVGIEDNSVRLWKIKNQENIKTYRGFSSYVNCLVMGSKTKKIIAGCKDRSIHLLDYDLNKIEIFRGHDSSIKGLALISDENLLVSGSLDSTIRVWDLTKKWQIYSFPTTSIFSIAASGTTIIAGSMSNIKIIDSNTHKESELPGHLGEIDYMHVEPDSKYLVTGSLKALGKDATLRIWNLSSAKLEKTMYYPAGFQSVKLTKDGRGMLFTFPDGVQKAYSVRGKNKWVEHSNAFNFLLLNRQKIKLR